MPKKKETAKKDNSSKFWLNKIARAETKRESWVTKAEKIIKRYKDERGDKYADVKQFNILWSNVETIKPALYSATPVPAVVRRFRDSNPVARTAAEILQRCLSFSLEAYDFDLSMRQVILDLLLSGVGVNWVRYEPEFEQVETTDPMTGETVMEDSLAYEKVVCDYVHWKDFIILGEPRVWQEVKAVGRRVYMTRKDGVRRFGDIFNQVSLDYKAEKSDVISRDDKATVWEIWSKDDGKVYWVAKGYDGYLDERDPPIKFHDFFPCPRPLFATLGNDCLIPTPDYCEYQDQAAEMDSMTARIHVLLGALRVAGVYNGEVKELNQLLTGDMSNKLVPVSSWAAFSEKGGFNGAIQFLPIKEIVDTVTQLYAARERTKNDLYEITGISDIIRGATAASETATAQRIKAQWGSIRLRDRQADVQRYIRDLIRLKAEVIAEVFQPETIMQMSGVELPTRQQVQMQQMQQGMQPETQPQQPEVTIEDVIELLKQDKLRSYNIDIETDSTIAPDETQEKQDRMEFLTATTQFLQNMGGIVSAQPELMPLAKSMLLFGVKAFKVGSSLEETIEKSMDAAHQSMMAPKPPPPDPNQAKMAEVEANTQIQREKLSSDQQLKQAELMGRFQLKREETAMDFAAEREKLITEEARNINPYMG